MPSKEELAHRARVNWLTRFPHRPEPTWSATTVEVHDGRTYVVLRRSGQVVDIYRYKPESIGGWHDSLKLLASSRGGRYWPKPYGTYKKAGGYAAA
jgi:hypothetical protein